MKYFISLWMAGCLLGLSLFSCSSFAESTDIDPDKKRLIHHLLQQTGQTSQKVGQQFSDLFIRQMEQSLKHSNPDIDPKAFTIVREEIHHVIQEELLENQRFATLLYPIYAKRFSVKELKQIVDFNDSPVGQKMIRSMPQITQEAMQVGQMYGRELVPKIKDRILARFKAEGIR